MATSFIQFLNIDDGGLTSFPIWHVRGCGIRYNEVSSQERIFSRSSPLCIRFR
ncbi:MAG: hypothetical protein KDA78_15315 [Planctomycetaceae bacterium]|nr:hypothetical protein [Planctomycetaceae bacterium]